MSSEFKIHAFFATDVVVTVPRTYTPVSHPNDRSPPCSVCPDPPLPAASVCPNLPLIGICRDLEGSVGIPPQILSRQREYSSGTDHRPCTTAQMSGNPCKCVCGTRKHHATCHPAGTGTVLCTRCVSGVLICGVWVHMTEMTPLISERDTRKHRGTDPHIQPVLSEVCVY